MTDFVHGKINSCKGTVRHCEDGFLPAQRTVVQNTSFTKSSSLVRTHTILHPDILLEVDQYYFASLWSEPADKILELFVLYIV